MTWSRCTSHGVCTGVVSGTLLGITAWLISTRALLDSESVDHVTSTVPALIGLAISLLTSPVITLVVSLACSEKDASVAWDTRDHPHYITTSHSVRRVVSCTSSDMSQVAQMQRHASENAAGNPIGGGGADIARTSGDYGHLAHTGMMHANTPREGVDKDSRSVWKWAVALVALFTVIYPGAGFLAGGTFGQEFFTYWVIMMFVCIIFSVCVCILMPLYQATGAISSIASFAVRSKKQVECIDDENDEQKTQNQAIHAVDKPAEPNLGNEVVLGRLSGQNIALQAQAQAQAQAHAVQVQNSARPISVADVLLNDASMPGDIRAEGVRGGLGAHADDAAHKSKNAAASAIQKGAGCSEQPHEKQRHHSESAAVGEDAIRVATDKGDHATVNTNRRTLPSVPKIGDTPGGSTATSSSTVKGSKHDPNRNHDAASCEGRSANQDGKHVKQQQDKDEVPSSVTNTAFNIPKDHPFGGSIDVKNKKMVRENSRIRGPSTTDVQYKAVRRVSAFALSSSFSSLSPKYTNNSLSKHTLGDSSLSPKHTLGDSSLSPKYTNNSGKTLEGKKIITPTSAAGSGHAGEPSRGSSRGHTFMSMLTRRRSSTEGEHVAIPVDMTFESKTYLNKVLLHMLTWITAGRDFMTEKRYLTVALTEARWKSMLLAGAASVIFFGSVAIFYAGIGALQGAVMPFIHAILLVMFLITMRLINSSYANRVYSLFRMLKMLLMILFLLVPLVHHILLGGLLCDSSSDVMVWSSLGVIAWCVYMCVCVCTCVCMHARSHVCMHACMNVCVCVCVCCVPVDIYFHRRCHGVDHHVWGYVSILIYVANTHIQICILTQTQIYIHTRPRTQRLPLIHTHTY
jgi:hypothetical protein